MHTAYIAVTLVTIAMNTAIVVADLARAEAVLTTSGEVGLPPKALPVLAWLKAAGAAGLLLGLLGFEPIGIAAATGLVLFFVSAVGAHIRARVFYNIAFPGTYLAFAAASLTLAITQ